MKLNPSLRHATTGPVGAPDSPAWAQDTRQQGFVWYLTGEGGGGSVQLLHCLDILCSQQNGDKLNTNAMVLLKRYLLS